MKLETLILSNLLHDEDYLRKVIPHLKDEYFSDWAEKRVFNEITSFAVQYNALPTKESLHVAFIKSDKLNEDEYARVIEVVDSLTKTESNKEWLLNETEQFCKKKAVFNAISQSIQIMNGKDKVMTEDAIPSILQEALGVCFDNSVGHDYIDDAEKRFDFYHKVESKIPFDLEYFNKITKGGLPRKTLNIVLAGTGVGKTLFMTHVAAGNLAAGRNVLYITMEMAEERIAERIDANLMNVTMEDLQDLPKQMFDDRIGKIVKKTQGKLVIKEYPTSTAHAGHFRALLNELKMKKNFVPDIIFIDYLNICASARYKMSGSVNSYIYIKGIAEELRGLAVEFNVPIMSATQTTRGGYANSDVELTDTSESFGLPATADFLFAIISTEDLEKLGQLLVKQLKNRYNDVVQNKRFLIGVDRNKMRLYDLDESAQKNIMVDEDSGPKYPTSEPSAVSSRTFQKNFDGIVY